MLARLMDTWNQETDNYESELKYNEINLELLITIVVICLLQRIWADV
jgi:hypothetical protein